jgi:hypothetical protein
MEEASAIETTEYPAQSDSTVANASLTQVDQPSATLTNGHDASHDQVQDSSFDEGGNVAAEANWDTSNDLSTSQEWVEVPRNATETDTGATVTPAAVPNVQSWADDQPENPTEVRTLVSFVYNFFAFIFDYLFLLRFFRMSANNKPLQNTSTPPANPNDGFHEVHRSRGNNRVDGQQRGRGRRGGDRGRGDFRGDFRGGRGRSGPRGGARGQRRSDES